MKDRVSLSEVAKQPLEITAVVSIERPESSDLRQDIADYHSFALLLGCLVSISLLILLGKYPNLVKATYQTLGDEQESYRCRSCTFFDKNLYLKCAVHPNTVLTKEAMHCPDYWPLHNKPYM